MDTLYYFTAICYLSPRDDIIFVSNLQQSNSSELR